MNRRTFVKTLLLTIPGLYIYPYSCLKVDSWANQKQDLVIYFVGEYGRQIMTRFRHLKAQNPIMNKCRHVTMTINPDEALIPVFDDSACIELLAKAHGCRLGILVLDAGRKDSVAQAETLSRVLKINTDGMLICLTPAISQGCPSDLSNLTIETFSRNKDLSAPLLLTLYNTYLGCGGMGNIQCLKYLLDAMELKNKHLRASAGIAVHQGNIDQIDIANFVMEAVSYIQGPRDAYGNNPVYGILEMNPLEENALSFYCEVSNGVGHAMGFIEPAMIVHLGLKKSEVKLTIIAINDKEVKNADI